MAASYLTFGLHKRRSAYYPAEQLSVPGGYGVIIIIRIIRLLSLGFRLQSLMYNFSLLVSAIPILKATKMFRETQEYLQYVDAVNPRKPRLCSFVLCDL